MSKKENTGDDSIRQIISKALTRKAEWSDKDDILDVLYWGRQFISLIIGVLWGIIPLKGLFAIVLYVAISTFSGHLWVTNYQDQEDEQFGGFWELGKEGFGAAFATFMNGQALRTDRDFESSMGAWALWPILRKLANCAKNASWFFIAEPYVEVKWNEMIDFVSDKNPEDEVFVGRALVDKNPVIIHHFYGFQGSEKTILYPDFAAGVLLSKRTLERIAKVADQHDKSDFTIDAKHEFAKFIYDSTGIELVNSPRFCLMKNETDGCITNYVAPTFEGCEPEITNEDVFYAVKTFGGHHRSRVVYIKRTWTKQTKHVQFYSDQEDNYIPTIELDVPNVERGHCAKTLSIIKHFLEDEEVKHVPWLVIADDDTLLSVHRLQRLLSCVPSTGKIIVGERYAYGLDPDGIGGYDYPTGGAGMVFSRETARHLVAAYDMTIGSCARRLNVPVIHSAAFHQAQRRDYSPLYVQRIEPISFHKLEGIDPYQEYMDYLHVPESKEKVHTEL
ncbi:hypothetical protein M3Y96_00620800 [Aphelenchoides besseyi]|nr:hypothetical protein M3Y96_00620800 [Aphelenchoides besseyi]